MKRKWLHFIHSWWCSCDDIPHWVRHADYFYCRCGRLIHGGYVLPEVVSEFKYIRDEMV